MEHSSALARPNEIGCTYSTVTPAPRGYESAAVGRSGLLGKEPHYGPRHGHGACPRAAEARPADAVPPPTEEQLEQAIRAASDRMCEAIERKDKITHWREMARLIDRRCPHYARFLERMRVDRMTGSA